jgi:hypothetical protein
MSITWLTSKLATWHALYKARPAFALQLSFPSSVRMNFDVRIMLKLRDGVDTVDCVMIVLEHGD